MQPDPSWFLVLLLLLVSLFPDSSLPPVAQPASEAHSPLGDSSGTSITKPGIFDSFTWLFLALHGTADVVTHWHCCWCHPALLHKGPNDLQSLSVSHIPSLCHLCSLDVHLGMDIAVTFLLWFWLSLVACPVTSRSYN